MLEVWEFGTSFLLYCRQMCRKSRRVCVWLYVANIVMLLHAHCGWPVLARASRAQSSLIVVWYHIQEHRLTDCLVSAWPPPTISADDERTVHGAAAAGTDIELVWMLLLLLRCRMSGHARAMITAASLYHVQLTSQQHDISVQRCRRLDDANLIFIDRCSNNGTRRCPRVHTKLSTYNESDVHSTTRLLSSISPLWDVCFLLSVNHQSSSNLKVIAECLL